MRTQSARFRTRIYRVNNSDTEPRYTAVVALAALFPVQVFLYISKKSLQKFLIKL